MSKPLTALLTSILLGVSYGAVAGDGACNQNKDKHVSLTESSSRLIASGPTGAGTGDTYDNTGTTGSPGTGANTTDTDDMGGTGASGSTGSTDTGTTNADAMRNDASGTGTDTDAMDNNATGAGTSDSGASTGGM